MNYNIVLIDQGDDVLRILSRVLIAAGHRTACLSCEVESVAKIVQLCPDLIIIEISRSELLAREIITRLYQQRSFVGKSIPVIVISDFPLLEFELPYISGFITKPVDFEKVCERIDTITKGVPCWQVSSKNAHPSPEELKKFQDYLLAHSGLYFDSHNFRNLERGLNKRMAALTSKTCQDYYQYLTAGKGCRDELQKLIQLLTVGESFFFRQQGHFTALIETVLPDIADSKGGERIRLWSAGCSTGEEPYSLAMAVMEAVPDWKSRDVRIVGSDINRHSLMRAVEGGYTSWKLRVTGEKFIDKYFNRLGEYYFVKDEVKALVDFTPRDLLGGPPSPNQAMSEGFDAIFCRNVLIYFTRETAAKVVEKFAEALRPGGYLFLGHSETILGISTKFERLLNAGGGFYRKRDEQRVSVGKAHSVALLAGEIKSPPLPHGICRQQETASISVCEEGKLNYDVLYKEAIVRKQEKNYLLAEKLFGKILAGKPDHKDALVGEAMIQAYNGKFNESLERCNKALLIDDLLPGAFFVKGYVYEMTGRVTEAIDEYKKVILLKMDLVMPHYRLGKLYSRKGRYKCGKLSLKNCLKYLANWESEAVVPYSGGLSGDIFLGQLRSELSRIDVATGYGQGNGSV